MKDTYTAVVKKSDDWGLAGSKRFLESTVKSPRAMN